MSTSTDAILFYGYVWTDEESPPWSRDDDDNDEDADDRYARLAGFTDEWTEGDDGYFDRRVKVLAKDVIWAQDATQVARIDGKKILAEVVKDRGTLGSVAMAVGRPAKGWEIVEMLEGKKREGCLPLVLATDNGSS